MCFSQCSFLCENERASTNYSPKKELLGTLNECLSVTTTAYSQILSFLIFNVLTAFETTTNELLPQDITNRKGFVLLLCFDVSKTICDNRTTTTKPCWWMSRNIFFFRLCASKTASATGCHCDGLTGWLLKASRCTSVQDDCLTALLRRTEQPAARCHTGDHQVVLRVSKTEEENERRHRVSLEAILYWTTNPNPTCWQKESEGSLTVGKSLLHWWQQHK